MKIPFKTVISFGVLAVLTALPYQNCSSYHDPSPFAVGDTSSASTSSPSDIRLDAPSGVIDVSPVELAISAGGECNVGLSTKHYIEIRMADVDNKPIMVREDSICSLTAASVPNDCFRAIQFRCEHGKYYVHLPINCGSYRQANQSMYRLLGQLVTVDSNGQETRDVKASFERYFSIGWGTGVCP